jgi:hypothetical protein
LKPLPNELLALIIKIILTTNYQLLLNCNKVHRAVDASTTSKMLVQLRNRPEAHRLFLLMVTESVNQMCEFHQMLDGQFLRYREVLGPSSDDDNWLLCGNFGSTVLKEAYKARLIGADALSGEVDHVRVAMFLWSCLQTHRVMQGYIDLEFITHPEIGAVIVEHLINTRTPMPMHSSLKSENAELRLQIKALTSNYEKLESRLGRNENVIKKLKDKK